jgi:hypothetical protein
VNTGPEKGLAGMPGLFDSINGIVIGCFVKHGLVLPGQGYGAESYYTGFSRLVLNDREGAVSLVSDILRKVYDRVRDIAHDPNTRKVARAGDRAKRRAVTELSEARRSRSFHDEEDLELTVERTIIYAQTKNPSTAYDWYNQFNVASGILGSHADRRTAMDILRQDRANPRLLDLVELKEWESGDHPFYAATEIFQYFSALQVFGKEGLDPNYKMGRWPPFDAARLLVLAPSTWFDEWGRIGDADETIRVFRDALERVKNERPAIGSGSYFARGLRLEGLTKSEFTTLFRGGTPEEPHFSYDNLSPEAVSRLIDWVDRAFQPTIVTEVK